MTSAIMRHCLSESLRRLPNHPQYKHYVHYSFAVVDGSVVVVGTNKSAVPPVHFGYNSRVPEPKIHSELDAYRKLRKCVSISKTDWELVNVRVNRSGEMKKSKPCSVCAEWLQSVGCKGVTYTTESGWEYLRWV